MDDFDILVLVATQTVYSLKLIGIVVALFILRGLFLNDLIYCCLQLCLFCLILCFYLILYVLAVLILRLLFLLLFLQVELPL